MFSLDLFSGDGEAKHAKGVNALSDSDSVSTTSRQLEQRSLSNVANGLSLQVIDLHLEGASTSLVATSNGDLNFVASVDAVSKFVRARAAVTDDTSKSVKRHSVLVGGTELALLVRSSPEYLESRSAGS